MSKTKVKSKFDCTLEESLMERTISQEERIRRAEEIYQRRRRSLEYSKQNKNYINYDKTEKKTSNIRARILKKLFAQIVICCGIYFILYLLVNSNYFFAEEVHKKINEYMAYDINFSELYNAVNKYISDDRNILKTFFINHKEVNNTENINEEETAENEQLENIEDTGEEQDSESNDVSVNMEAVGGADTEELNVDSRSQEEIDAEYIKQNYGIIWPVNGVITSRFGSRIPTDIVTANHYGLDIGANIGTDVVAAMDGTVTLASSYGDYGNHLQIENGDVATLYAHCSMLCVTEGEMVSKGQKIAEVGQTRKSYGPTFTF